MNFYNDSVKGEFLNKFEEDTRGVYSNIFKKSKKLEEKYNTDVFNFDEESLKDLLKNYINPSTKQSARTYYNILSSYIQWGIDNKHSILTENPMARMKENWLTFVENQSSLYLKKSELDAILSRLVNAQDAFIIQALFDGIQGKEVSELTLLTREQIKEAEETGWLKLIDMDGNERTIKPDPKTINLAIIAFEDPEYYKKNGQFDYIDNIKDVVALPKGGEYILKPTATAKYDNKPISRYTVYNRLEMIKSLPEFTEYKECLNTKNIVRSGMLYEAKKIVDNNGKLDKKSIESICKKFGMSYKWALKDFLNEDTLNEVYSR